MIIMLDLNKILDSRLDKNGKRLTQDQLAKLTGVPQGTISKWIGGKIDRYDKDILIRLCYVLKCNLSDILIVEWANDHTEWDGEPRQYPRPRNNKAR